MATKKVLFAAILLASTCTPLSISAQTEACPTIATSKSEKLLEKAADADKYSFEKRVDFLRSALEEDPECYACAQALGHLLFLQFKRGGSTAEEAESVLSELVADCPEFAPEPWYELGALAYARGELPAAMERFEAFLSFEDDADWGKRYERQTDEVREVMRELEFEIAFRAHAADVTLTPVESVNTSADEYLPALSPDGSLLFFTHAERVKQKGDVVSQLIERFQWAHRDAGATRFDSPGDLAAPFNDGARYGGASISVDNRELFIAASNPVPENPENIDLFAVKYEVKGLRIGGGFEYEWGPMIPLPEAINSPDGWEAQPALSADGDELFFAAVKSGSMPDDQGNLTMDLMRSQRDGNGNWLAAEPLAELNTSSNEKSPFLHPDGKTLYFSSDRSPGGGGYDIWYSRRNDQGKWGQPTNIGAPINTSGDEHGLVVAADGVQAYLGSRRAGTAGLDILGLRLPPTHRASEVTIIRGSVLSPEGLPDSTTQVGLLNAETMERTFLDVNQDDGSFARAMEVTDAQHMVLFAEGPNTAFDALLIPPPPPSSSETSSASAPNLQLRAAAVKPGEPHEMRDILFSTNSAEMDRSSLLILTAFADYLNRNPSLRVAIHGHTDNLGSTAANQELSERRADAVLRHLVDLGVNEMRLVSKGYGPSQPRSTNDSEAGRAANRRTEFLILN